ELLRAGRDVDVVVRDVVVRRQRELDRRAALQRLRGGRNGCRGEEGKCGESGKEGTDAAADHGGRSAFGFWTRTVTGCGLPFCSQAKRTLPSGMTCALVSMTVGDATTAAATLALAFAAAMAPPGAAGCGCGAWSA